MTPCSIDGCEKSSARRGWCYMHYWRWRVHGDTELKARPPERPTRRRPDLIDKTDPNGCWVWLGNRNEKGYGRITRDGRTQRAHRYFYEQAIGPIPEGLTLDHLCRNTSCVNPAHLEPVTVQENLSRRHMAQKKEAGGQGEP